MAASQILRADAAEPLTQPPVTLAYLARQHLAAAGGDIRIASGRLSLLLEEDDDIRSAVIDAALSDALRMHLERAHRQERAAIFSQTPQRIPAPKTNIGALANVAARTLMEFPLAGGKRLRDASREEVEEQSVLYLTTGADMARKGTWLRRIAERLDPGQIVADAMTLDEVEEIHAEVCHG